MENLINSAIIPFINQGRISVVKMNQLISLKEFIDRVASRSYIIKDAVDEIVDKYGVAPDVVTWGDFFQTELAMDADKYTDEEFVRVIDTIKFDMMSAHQIFSDNTPEFFEWVENSSYDLIAREKNEYTESEQEILHLKILKDYFMNLSITDKFTVDELMWYNSFQEMEAASS